MMRFFGQMLVLLTFALLVSCGGGGDSSVTKVICKNVNCDRIDPAVGSFVQGLNNMQVKVEDGPRSFTFGPNTNILYATVRLCKPGADSSSATDCQSIDKIVVDTGSVGLRVLASQVKNLGLSPVATSATQGIWECFPFVVGGLWGKNVVADVLMGPLRTERPVAVQLIEEDLQNSPFKAPDSCLQWANGKLYDSATSLGANGILGIGSTNLDCGSGCTDVTKYGAIDVQYFSCPLDSIGSTACVPGAVGINQQVSNPIAALPVPFNKGFALAMPAVNDPGAATATGELIFGVDTISGPDVHANNTVPADVQKVYLGVDNVNHFDSYLNVTTVLKGRVYLNSYLDTGTNYLRFTDDSITLCQIDAISYCPLVVTNLSSTIADGDDPLRVKVPVSFHVGNSDDFIVTKNTAFGSLAAATTTLNAQKKEVKDYTTFAWGMPFFYGKKVYMSIWDFTKWDPITGAVLDPPWYAWTAL